MIWCAAAQTLRTIELVKPRRSRLTSTAAVPTLLHVTHESRTEVQRKVFTLISSNHVTPFYINIDLETLKLPNYNMWPCPVPAPVPVPQYDVFSNITVKRDDLPAALKGDFSHSIRKIDMVKKLIVKMSTGDLITNITDPRISAPFLRQADIYNIGNTIFAWYDSIKQFPLLEEFPIDMQMISNTFEWLSKGSDFFFLIETRGGQVV